MRVIDAKEREHLHRRPRAAAAAVLALALASCAPEVAPALAASRHPRRSSWHATEPLRPKRVELARTKTLEIAAQTAAREIGLGCTTVFVWGEVAAIPTSRAVVLAFDGHELAGFAVCEADMEAMLRAQLGNPKLERGGRSADLVVARGAFHLRRRWMSALAPLGQLDGPPSRVLQRDEVLAVLLDAGGDADANQVARGLEKAPRFFLFGMWILL